MRRPFAVLFDLDGTLVDTVPFILESVRHAFDGYGRAPTDAEWIAGIGTPLRTQLEGFARSPADVAPLLERYRAFWLEHHDRRTHAFPGAVEVVRSLHHDGHPIGVVTAKVESGAERTLRLVGLHDCVDVLVGADTVPRAKPDPLPVLHALQRLGRAPREALMIGDSPHDLAAARGAGVASVGACWGATAREALAPLADHLLSDVRDLAPLVAALEASAAG